VQVIDRVPFGGTTEMSGPNIPPPGVEATKSSSEFFWVKLDLSGELIKTLKVPMGKRR